MIDLAIRFENNLGSVIVPAEVVDVAPHLAEVATFAVHEAVNYDESWTVTNVETGRRVIGSESSRELAVTLAAVLLARKSVADIEAAYSASPRPERLAP